MERSTSTFEQFEDAAAPAIDKAARMAHETVDKVKPTVDRVAKKAHETVDKVAGAAMPAADWAAQRADDLTRQGDRLLAVSRNYIQERPLTILAAVLVLGYAFGRLQK